VAIAGLGTDIIEFARLNKSDATTERLAKRVLTPYELNLYVASNEPVRYLAKRFAAKEATVKALGTGIGNGVSWQHIEVRNNALGAPELHFTGEVAMLCEQRAITSSVISISDETHYAVATVILEN
jgi:holo-[acyl-carrier protein] synthase